MMNFIQTHGADALLAYFVFSAFVSGMPDPTAGSGVGYRWAYASLHVLAGDLSQFIGSRAVKP